MDIEDQLEGLAIPDDEEEGVAFENDEEVFPSKRLSYALLVVFSLRG